MTSTTVVRERRFDRASWLTLAGVLVFVLLALASTLAILVLPTDGWQIIYNAKPPPPLMNFAGDWPTPLRADDQVLAVNGVKVAGGEGIRPLPPTGWESGHTVTYTLLRSGHQLDVPVTLRHLDAAGLLRSFWFTMQDSPMEWSWSIIAILVFLLRPRNAAARLMLVAFVCHNTVTKLAWSATTISKNFAPAPVFYANELVNLFWGYLFFPAIILLALSFPQRIFPLNRWPRAVPAGLFGISLVLTLIAVVTASEPVGTVTLIGDGVLLILAFGAAIWNTRKLGHHPVARAQAIWVSFGFALCVIPILVSYLLYYSGILKLSDINIIFSDAFILVLPVCLAIAITRYHLFDVYLILRRTLQYSLLTVLLALVYFGGVILLQSLFSAVFGFGTRGQTQQIAIVLSTLAIAALFTPLRLRVQNFIDRRFFRSKYNSEQILAGFAATARTEMTLDPLTHALLDAIQETLQPEEMSLWIQRSPGKG